MRTLLEVTQSAVPMDVQQTLAHIGRVPANLKVWSARRDDLAVILRHPSGLNVVVTLEASDTYRVSVVVMEEQAGVRNWYVKYTTDDVYAENLANLLQGLAASLQQYVHV